MVNPEIWTPDKVRLAMVLILERSIMDYMNPNFFIKKSNKAEEYNPEDFFYCKPNYGYAFDFNVISDYLSIPKRKFLHTIEEFRMQGITYDDLLKKAHERQKRKEKKRKYNTPRKHSSAMLLLYQILLNEGRVVMEENYKIKKIRGKVDLNKVRTKVKEREEYESKQRKELKKKGIIKYEAVYNKKNDKLADLILLFGRWAGYRISELCDFPEGVNYIQRFLLNQENNFEDDFRDMVMRVASIYGDGRRSSY